MKTYHITFVRNRESHIYELPLHYTATVRAASLAKAIDKAKGKMRTELLGKNGYLLDWYKIVPVPEDRVSVRRFLDKNPIENIEYIRTSAGFHSRHVKVMPMTGKVMRKLLSGKDGIVVRFRSGLSIEEIRFDNETGSVTRIAHNLIARNGGVQ